MNNDTSLLIIFIGGLIAVMGLVGLHYMDKKNNIFSRLLVIFTVCFGLGLIWHEVAKKAPVVVNTKLEIFNKNDQLLILKGSYDIVRNCKLKDYISKQIYADNSSSDVKVGYFIVSGEKSTSSESYLFMRNPFYEVGAFPIEIKVQAVYECAFGVEIVDDFPSIDLIDFTQDYGI